MGFNGIFCVFPDFSCISQIVLPNLVKNQIRLILVLLWPWTSRSKQEHQERPQDFVRWLGFFSSKASMSHLLILNPLTYQRIMLIISELSRFDFICFIIYLLGSVIVFSQPFRIFLDILTPSSYNTSTFFFISSCHLIKPFPTKKVVPSLRSLCTCLYTSFCT